MVQGIERVERYLWGSGAAVNRGRWMWDAERLVLDCGCGESFVLDRSGVRSSIGKFSYSWLEDCIGRLEGKEARH
jgi:hypothetical protein